MKKVLLICVCALLLLAACAKAPVGEAASPPSATPVSTATPTPIPTPSPPPASAPTSEGYVATEEDIAATLAYWVFDEAWAFTTPSGIKGFDSWSIGLGEAHEFGLALPYAFLERVQESAQNLAAYSFAEMGWQYYEGLTVAFLSGFHNDPKDWPPRTVIYYLATTQPDCKTSRGLAVGATVEELLTLYPEVEEDEEAWVQEGITDFDRLFVYAPEGNRSMIFLVKNGAVVRIDMGDGLDGKYWSPRVVVYEKE